MICNYYFKPNLNKQAQAFKHMLFFSSKISGLLTYTSFYSFKNLKMIFSNGGFTCLGNFNCRIKSCLYGQGVSVVKRQEVFGVNKKATKGAVKLLAEVTIGVVLNLYGSLPGILVSTEQIKNYFINTTQILKKKWTFESRSRALADFLKISKLLFLGFFLFLDRSFLFMKRVLPGISRTGSNSSTLFDLNGIPKLGSGGNGPDFRGFASRVSSRINQKVLNPYGGKIVFNKDDLVYKLKADENFLDAGDYLIFASKDFALDPLNKTNHLHLLVKYGVDKYKEYTLKSNPKVRKEILPAIQFIHQDPLFLDKSEGQTFLFENPEFLGLEEAKLKIEKSSSDSLLGKGLDNFLDSENGRAFMENISLEPATEGVLAKSPFSLGINLLAYRAVHSKVVSDFRQKSDYVCFMDTKTSQKFYKHKDSFEAKCPSPYWKQAFYDQDTPDLKKLK